MNVKQLRKELKRLPKKATVVVVPQNPGRTVEGYELALNVDYDEEVDVVEVWF